MPFNKYPQAARNEVRQLDNPTELSVYVVDRDDHIFLDFESPAALPEKDRLDFFAYVYRIADIIESHGTKVAVKGIDVER